MNRLRKIHDADSNRPTDLSIRFEAISKRFGDFSALSEVSLTVNSGGIHALLGENGAGKTTLMRIASGELRPDDGRVVICGEGVSFAAPLDARRAGIRMVHQHLSLVPAFTVIENFILDEDGAPVFSRDAAVGEVISREANRFGMAIDPSRKIWEFSLAEQQWIEVFRAMHFGGRIVILDEPTSLLSPVEGDRLLAHLKTYAEGGRIVILITHKLREVMRFAQKVTVLHRGRAVETSAVQDMTAESLTALMMGGEASGRNQAQAARGARPKPPALVSLHDVAALDQRGRRLISGIELSLARGWICGVAGVAGSGQTELANVVSGLAEPAQGVIRTHDEKPIVRRYIPADRTDLGTCTGLSIGENLILRIYRDGAMSKRGALDWGKLASFASDLSNAFRIKMGSQTDRIATLSGGNIQRVVLARELSGDVDLLVAHNPTSGLDMATAEFVRDKLREAASRGTAILLISEDLDEILELADEILALHGGLIEGRFTRETATVEGVGAVMAGLAPARPLSSTGDGGAT